MTFHVNDLFDSHQCSVRHSEYFGFASYETRGTPYDAYNSYRLIACSDDPRDLTPQTVADAMADRCYTYETVFIWRDHCPALPRQMASVQADASAQGRQR